MNATNLCRIRIRFGDPARQNVKSPNPTFGNVFVVLNPTEQKDLRITSPTSSSVRLSLEKNTLEDSNDSTPTSASIVAFCNVPPDQVPDGVLTLLRSYRHMLQHVRVFLTDDQPQDSHESPLISSSSCLSSSSSFSLSSTSVPAQATPHRSYLILIVVKNAYVAQCMVQDLHDRPYTFLQKNVRAIVRKVIRMEDNTTGASILESLFAVGTIHSTAHTLVTSSKTFTSPNKSNATTPTSSNSTVTSTATTIWDKGSLLSGHSHPTISHSHSVTDHTSHSNHTSMNSNSSSNINSNSNIQDICPVCLESLHYPTIQTSVILSSISTSSSSSASSPTPPHTPTTLGTTTYMSPEIMQNIPLENKSATFTTLCNHSFHLECLLQCQDSPCPVCRYDHSGLNDSLSSCHFCGSAENIYICLICGVVSCQNDNAVETWMENFPTRHQTHHPHNSVTTVPTKNTLQEENNPRIKAEEKSCLDPPDTMTTVTSATTLSASTTRTPAVTRDSHHGIGHARAHYQQSMHAYALDVQSQHVFDFVGNGYVHRLIQNKEDGKLVEMNDPNNISSGNPERSITPGYLSDTQQEEVVHMKLEGLANRYQTMLRSLMEQQRQYYEERLNEIRRENEMKKMEKKKKKMLHEKYESRSISNEDDESQYSTTSSKYQEESSTTITELIAALKQDKNQLQQRCVSLKKKHSKIMEDVVFLKNFNENLEVNKEEIRQQISNAQKQRFEITKMLQRTLPPLEDKVKQLILQFENDGSTEEKSVGTMDDSNDDKMSNSSVP